MSSGPLKAQDQKASDQINTHTQQVLEKTSATTQTRNANVIWEEPHSHPSHRPTNFEHWSYISSFEKTTF